MRKDLKEATANAEAMAKLSKNLTNSAAYLVAITMGKKDCFFVCTKKPLFGSSYVEFQGFAVESLDSIKDISTGQDAVEFATDKGKKSQELIVSTNKFLYVENLTFKNKNK